MARSSHKMAAPNNLMLMDAPQQYAPPAPMAMGAASAGFAGGAAEAADASGFAEPQMAFGAPPGRGGDGGFVGANLATKMRAAAPEAQSGGAAPLAGAVILRSGSVSCEAMDVAAAAARVLRDAADALGGFAESQSQRQDQWLRQRWEAFRAQTVAAGGTVAPQHAAAGSGPTHADMHLRVPSERFEEARAAVRAAAAALGGRVTSEDASGIDVSEQYVDVVARQSVDAKALAQLDVLLGAAATVHDVLQVRREMDQVSARLEGLAAQRKSLEGRAKMSSLSVSIAMPQPPQPPQPTPSPRPGWSPGDVFASALRSLGGAAQVFAEVLIYFAVFAVPVGVCLSAAFVGLKRFSAAA
jgi:hypothetical protein